ncbi:glutathione S-transferase U17-like [Andrographis paniculata]|uniref:glutathione S-transferase U17-like n=1 Tax=Andrographis paniculata TaxID=175694 RepID=UPI0021E85D33|nr:glutathione S-transferase U17-like [Andrographis paniculata]
MADTDVKVLGSWLSPYVNRVAMALKLKSIKYELVEMNPHQKTELLAKHNPIHKKVPVLIHADRSICESLIIVQYIDESWPNGPSILPSDPHDRSAARFWAAYIDDKWSPLFREVKEAKDDDEKRVVMEKIQSGLVLLEEAFVMCSKGRDFFNGDEVGYLDIALGSFLGWIGVTETMIGIKVLDAAMAPNLVSWADRLYCSSSVKDVMLQTPALLEVLKKLKAAKDD